MSMIMFSRFFSKKKEEDTSLYKQIVINSGKLLPVKYAYIEKQAVDGIIKAVKAVDGHFPNYKKFQFDGQVVRKYEDKNGRQFILKGTFVYDQKEQKYVPINFIIAYGLIIGLSSPAVKTLTPDLNSIKVENFNVEYLGEDEFLEIKHLFNVDELQLINPSEVYEVELGGRLYYHLKDTGDGDFIGIDKEKRIFRITHDPYQVSQLDSDLSSVLRDNG